MIPSSFGFRRAVDFGLCFCNDVIFFEETHFPILRLRDWFWFVFVSYDVWQSACFLFLLRSLELPALRGWVHKIIRLVTWEPRWLGLRVEITQAALVFSSIAPAVHTKVVYISMSEPYAQSKTKIITALITCHFMTDTCCISVRNMQGQTSVHSALSEYVLHWKSTHNFLLATDT